MLQNAGVTAFTISELLRENQPPRLELKLVYDYLSNRKQKIK